LAQGETTLKELDRKMGLRYDNFKYQLSILMREDLVEMRKSIPYNVYHIKGKYAQLVENWLSQPHIAKL
jgi:hypothetical protein